MLYGWFFIAVFPQGIGLLRGMDVQDVYPCDTHGETIIHLLRDFPFAQKSRDGIGISLSLAGSYSKSLREWIERMRELKLSTIGLRFLEVLVS